jgi:gamma-glutamylputrescine oxidase
MRPDVVVVGGGVTGFACALALTQGGMRVRLHEAREIASGASGRNGGFALRGGAMPYDHARRQLGREAAIGLWRLTERYLERLAGLAGDAFRAVGSLRLAADTAEREELHAEYDALREDGFEADWLDELPPASPDASPERSETPMTGRGIRPAGCGAWPPLRRKPVRRFMSGAACTRWVTSTRRTS